MSMVPVDTVEEDAADLQFPKGKSHSVRWIVTYWLACASAVPANHFKLTQFSLHFTTKTLNVTLDFPSRKWKIH